MRITQRVGANSYVTAGVFFWVIGMIVLAAAALYVLVMGLLGIGAILLGKRMLRRWPWTQYLGLIWLVGIVLSINVGLCKEGGWGIACAVVADLLIVAGILALGAVLVNQQPSPPPPSALPLSWSEQIRYDHLRYDAETGQVVKRA